MNKIFIIGDPVKNSLSPTIFQHWSKKYKIKYNYRKKRVSDKNVNIFFKKTIKEKNCLGANITIPHKKRAFDFVDKKTKHAKEISAINCVYKNKKKLIGTNTDWIGFLKSYKHQNKNFSDKKRLAAVIGFGGASRAILYALKKIGYKRIRVFVRDLKKTSITGSKIKGISFDKIQNINKHSKKYDMVINTAPANTAAKIKLNVTKLNKNCIVSDINYNPHNTKLIREAKKNKLKVNYGIYMLIFQAAPAFRIWFGFSPKVDEALIRKCLKKRRAS